MYVHAVRASPRRISPLMVKMSRVSMSPSFFSFKYLRISVYLSLMTWSFAVVEDLVEPVDEVQEADNFFIAYGNVTGSFVSHMHVMFLLYQTTDGASHGDNVIIGMRRKYDHTLDRALHAQDDRCRQHSACRPAIR